MLKNGRSLSDRRSACSRLGREATGEEEEEEEETGNGKPGNGRALMVWFPKTASEVAVILLLLRNKDLCVC